MQNPKWVIGLASAFVLMTILSLILEGVYGLESQKLLILMSPKIWPLSDVKLYLDTLWGIMWFDYAFFYGSWNIIRFGIFVPITVGLMVALIVDAVSKILGR